MVGPKDIHTNSIEILRNGNWNDLWRLCHGEVVPVVMSQGIFECLDAEARLHRDRQSPCQKPAAEPVEHDRQIDEAAGAYRTSSPDLTLAEPSA